MKWWQIIIAVAAMSAIAFLAGRCTSPEGGRTPPETVRDTIRDTTVIEKPVMVAEWYEGTIEVPKDSLIIVTKDSMEVVRLKKEVREYRSEDYYARVSGYAPVLERIEVYPQTITIREKARRNEISLSVDMSYINSLNLAAEIRYMRKAGIFSYGGGAGYDMMLHKWYITAGIEIGFAF